MVSDQTLDTDMWTSIRTVLVAAAPKVVDVTGTSTASILAAYNDKRPNLPQVIINPIEKDEADFKFGSNQGKKAINVVVDCYYSNGDGADQLNQSVDYALKQTPISGVELIGLTSNINFDLVNEKKYHLKSTTYTYLRE